MSRRIKDFLVALSLANLAYIRIWNDTLYDYSEWSASGLTSLAALVLNVLLLSLLVWLAIRLVRRSSSPAVQIAGRALFLVLFVVSVNGVRPYLPDFLGNGLSGRLGGVGLLLAGAILGALFSHRQTSLYLLRSAAFLLVLMSPLTVVLAGNGVWLWYGGYIRTAGAPSPAIPSHVRETPRVVWIVFDELDYRLAFEERPPSVHLTAFDRFRNQSIDASQAIPPGDYTLESMTSLTTGRLVTKVQPSHLDEWMLTLEDQHEAGWSTLPNLFSMAREAGFHSGLAGWYLPYCRIIGRDLTVCSSPLARDRHRHMPLAEAIFDQAREALPALLPGNFIDKNPRFSSQYQKETRLLIYKSAAEHATRLALDTRLGVVLLHYPVPHTPGIYNRASDEFAVREDNNYLDNLQLADRTLARLRHAMEEAGLWDKTIVLVTSDHRWRPDYWRTKADWTSEEEAVAAAQPTPDYRVPYLLKLTEQHERHVYEQQLPTLVTRDLILALVSGELKTVDGVLRWLDRRSLAE